MPTLTLTIPNGPTYTVHAMALDLAIVRYLPESAAGLRAIVCDRSKLPEWMLDQVKEATSFLIMLAALDNGQVAPAAAA